MQHFTWLHFYSLPLSHTSSSRRLHLKSPRASSSSSSSPAPLLLRLLCSERAVFGLRGEVVPAVDREGLKRAVWTLGEDVVRGVLCHPSLLLALESETDRGVFSPSTVRETGAATTLTHTNKLLFNLYFTRIVLLRLKSCLSDTWPTRTTHLVLDNTTKAYKN